MPNSMESKNDNASGVAETERDLYKNAIKKIREMILEIMQTPISERERDVYFVTLTRIYNLCIETLYQNQGR